MLRLPSGLASAALDLRLGRDGRAGPRALDLLEGHALAAASPGGRAGRRRPSSRLAGPCSPSSVSAVATRRRRGSACLQPRRPAAATASSCGIRGSGCSVTFLTWSVSTDRAAPPPWGRRYDAAETATTDERSSAKALLVPVLRRATCRPLGGRHLEYAERMSRGHQLIRDAERPGPSLPVALLAALRASPSSLRSLRSRDAKLAQTRSVLLSGLFGDGGVTEDVERRWKAAAIESVGLPARGDGRCGAGTSRTGGGGARTTWRAARRSSLVWTGRRGADPARCLGGGCLACQPRMGARTSDPVSWSRRSRAGRHRAGTPAS